MFNIKLTSKPNYRDAAISMCMSKGNEQLIDKIIEDGVTEEMVGNIFECGVKKGHSQIIKHIDFMFVIKGLSRGGFDELRTHEGFTKFMAKSTRYCKEFDIADWPREKFNKDEIISLKQSLAQLKSSHHDQDVISRKHSLYIDTPFTMKSNLLHLIHIIGQRSTEGAHEELNILVDEIYNTLKKDGSWQSDEVCRALEYKFPKLF